ncbi:MAG: glycoside hydrolase family 16 protein [Clostridia bacterium]|nr:glycoside hydrolase family 16 protein [Clostridia bacterium]MBR5422530.1 glycoside hydrolase family 16 protein [Clostridia bacterium]
MHQLAELFHLAFRQEDSIYRVSRIAAAAFAGGFTLKKFFAIFVAFVEMFGCVLFDHPLTPAGDPLDLTGYELVFCDDFGGETLDTEAWRYRASGKRRGGFNGAEAVRLEGGNLIIKAFYNENGEYGAGWYTGMISLNRLYKNGYFEIRCKCNPGGGFWSAFWIQAQHPYDHELSKGGVGGAELDIFEAMGGNEKTNKLRNAVTQTIHCNGGDDDPENLDSRIVGSFYVDDIYDTYNTYGLKWTEDEYIFYINGVETARSSFSLGVSEVPEEVIVSLEMPNEIDYDTDYTTEFVVDYVKIWQTAGE